MAAEIRDQPRVLERILREGRPEIQAVAQAVGRRGFPFVVLAARGTSDHAALYAKYLVETCLGLPAGLASPSTVTVYDAHPTFSGGLFVAVSQSGASPDLIEGITRARAGGAITVAVTNAPGSSLAAAAEYHLDVRAGAERAVAATKTYTAQLLTLYLFVQALRGAGGDEALAIPAEAERILDRGPLVAQLAVRYRFAEQLITTSRGYNYATALEAALKLMETTYVVAHAFSSADLLHGPMAMIDRGFPVIAIIPRGPGGGAVRAVLEELRQRDADSLVVGDPAAATLGSVGLPLPELGAEALSPILAILPLQQLAWQLARERQIDPDQPRGLRKVTETW